MKATVSVQDQKFKGKIKASPNGGFVDSEGVPDVKYVS